MTTPLPFAAAIGRRAWLSEAARKLRLLEEAICRRSDDEIADHCRWLRGGAATVGATLILDVCNAIEMATRYVEPRRAKSLVADALDYTQTQWAGSR